jgi:uncharacterized iron-regulated protein
MATRPLRRVTGVVFLLAAATVVVSAQASYVPQRVFDSAKGQFSDFESMVADVAHADVVFLGEQHDNAAGHRLELAVLDGLARRRSDVILGLEMFERDIQEPLGHFSMGHIPEADFLQVARPWPHYTTDYKPSVDFAIAHDWSVIATNAPQSVVTEVSKGGLDILKAKSAEDRKFVAADLQCPTDGDYHGRFLAAMADHPVGDAQTMDRIYLAQCVRDETMGESIAQAWQVGAVAGKPLVVHLNGAFHSDFHEGTAASAARRLPGKRLVVVSLLPVENLDAVSPDAAERRRADYLVYALK